MKRQCELKVRDVVWAKVEPYPWWPGKIVKRIQQNQLKVYKVSFFADPTYCYLHAHQIRPFSDLYTTVEDSYNLKLRKAIELANTHLDKLPCHEPIKPHEAFAAASLLVTLEVPYKQKKLASEAQNMMRMGQSMIQQGEEGRAESIQSYSQSRQIPFQEITIQNVTEMLDKYTARPIHSSYCYQTRKTYIKYQHKLKTQLLRKYKLDQVAIINHASFRKNATYKNVQTQPQEIINPTKKVKKISKIKAKKIIRNNQIDDLHSKCLKKLYTIVKGIDDVATVKTHIIEVMKLITFLSNGSHIKLKGLFITLIKFIKNSSCCPTNLQKLTNFQRYLDRLDSEKHEDEQGSKMTQISVNL